MLLIDRVASSFIASESVPPVGLPRDQEALGRAWSPTAAERRAGFSEQPRPRLQLALARVDQALQEAQAQQEHSCRVMFRCQDGWTALDMKTLARQAQTLFEARARGFADRFETDRARQHVWVELTW